MSMINKNDKNYTKRKEVVASFFSDKEYENNMTLKQSATILCVPKQEMEMFKNIIDELVEDGVIFFNKNKKIVKTEDLGYIKGLFEQKSKRFGIVTDVNKNEYYIADKDINFAMDGDEVLVSIISNSNSKDKRTEAKIEKIIKRSNKKVSGIFTNNKSFGFVEPLDGKGLDIFIPKKYIKNVKDGDVVEVEIIKYATKDSKPEGKIVKKIGNPKNDELVYVKALYKSYALDKQKDFNELVLKEIEKIPDEVLASEEIGRVDRTDVKAVTIDSEDAKDLDDACFVKKMPNGNYVLSVFIADVSHYVKDGTNLDKEAVARGTSVYIPGTVIPMLPKKLSNGICSLNAGVKRLALGVDIVIDSNGKVENSEVYKAVIKVEKKMSYEKVYKVLKRSDEQVLEEYKEFIDDIDTMSELAKILYKKRKKEGSIDFDIPETKVYLDEDGNVKDIKPYPINEANKIIEEFMLVTNMVIAEKFFFLEMPFIYRIHEKPDEERLREFNEILNNYNRSIKSVKNIHPKVLADIVDSIEDEQEKETISNLMLRTLKIAKYSNECLGHFGLAARYYTHFTSPIRRYPDLFIHRVISEYLDNKGYIDENRIAKFEKQAYRYSYSSSDAEKLATKIERDFVNLYEAMFMKKHINEEFENVTIASVTSFGIFVRLPNTIEGFVSFDSLPGNDYYIYDDKKKMLIGRNSSKTFKVGDKVTVKLIRADAASKQIDFKIL